MGIFNGRGKRRPQDEETRSEAVKALAKIKRNSMSERDRAIVAAVEAGDYDKAIKLNDKK